MKTEVIHDPAEKSVDQWRVAVDGTLTTPTFNSPGAAKAYAALLQSGYRKPEFR